MHTGHFQWTTGTLAGFVATGVVALLVLAALILAVSALVQREGLLAAIFGGGALLLVVGVAWAWFPYDKRYHALETVHGTVSEVASRQIAKDEGFEQKFVVRFLESPQEYGCEDTRCALVKPGDQVTLKCQLKWDRTGTDGFDCKWGKNEGTGQ